MIKILFNGIYVLVFSVKNFLKFFKFEEFENKKKQKRNHFFKRITMVSSFSIEKNFFFDFQNHPESISITKKNRSELQLKINVSGRKKVI